MRFSAVALLTLAHGILAMPKISDKTNEMAKRSAQTDNQDICLRICYFEELQCTEGWVSNISKTILALNCANIITVREPAGTTISCIRDR